MDRDGRDAEFTEYVATRWPRLVRSAVLLGCSTAEAEDVVQAALTLDDWEEGPNYGRSWEAVERGTSTITITITADRESVVIGTVTVIVR